jgi:histidinol-phosphatase
MTDQPAGTPATSDLLDFALAIANEADALAMSFYRGELGTEAKDDGTLVTRADRAVETLLRERITERYPEHAILGEEEGYVAGSRGAARWILDPIDGTHGFARGLPVWATLIALERDGEVELGVVSAPALGTRWWAARGQGAWRDAGTPTPGPSKGERTAAGAGVERIHVSAVDRLEDAQVLYGSLKLTEQRWPSGFRALIDRVWRTRGFGDFWQHCLVAEGAAEVGLEGEIKAWDIAALQVILEEAGGRLTSDDGIRGIDVPNCVTTNGLLHEEVIGLLRG